MSEPNSSDKNKTIAYCEKKPMTIEEYKSLVYEREAQVSAESFGRNEQHYQEWLKSNGT